MTVAGDIISDLPHWQSMLGRHAPLFSALEPGCGVALVPKAATERKPDSILVWRATEAGMVAERGAFSGYKETDLDLLFLCEDEALTAIYAAAEDQPLVVIKSAMRQGQMRLFVLRCRNELIERGWENFLETMGMAYLGACR